MPSKVRARRVPWKYWSPPKCLIYVIPFIEDFLFLSYSLCEVPLLVEKPYLLIMICSLRFRFIFLFTLPFFALFFVVICYLMTILYIRKRKAGYLGIFMYRFFISWLHGSIKITLHKYAFQEQFSPWGQQNLPTTVRGVSILSVASDLT